MLYQNYPNPFNPVTKISFDIPKASNVSLTVFDSQGKEVKSYNYGKLSTGSYSEFFDERISRYIFIGFMRATSLRRIK
jgi:hypothetical protein